MKTWPIGTVNSLVVLIETFDQHMNTYKISLTIFIEIIFLKVTMERKKFAN